ncbi:MAG: Ig-like domain-containing protein [Lachnospiraceae bacterium]|nr:Ig-like domain-containing protein [Lachnospiraceae bacterium]
MRKRNRKMSVAAALLSCVTALGALPGTAVFAGEQGMPLAEYTERNPEIGDDAEASPVFEESGTETAVPEGNMDPEVDELSEDAESSGFYEVPTFTDPDPEPVLVTGEAVEEFHPSFFDDVPAWQHTGESFFGYMDMPELEAPASVSDYGDDYDTRVMNAGQAVDLLKANSVSANFVPKDLPDLRAQSPYGACWTFSSLALAEISLARQGLAVNKDLSELHLAYFTYHSVTDPLGGTAGDCNEAKYGNGSNFMTRGGNLALSKNVLASWTGAAAEETAPYPEAAVVIEEGLDESLAYLDAAHLSNYYEVNIKEDPQKAKQLIAQNGGLGVQYHSASGTSAAGSGSNYDAEYNSYYSSTKATANHAVTLVGWDDHFPREHFKKKPEKDGAWLVRNSWMSGTGGYEKAENRCYSGYFWMSYEEATLGDTGYSFVFDLNDKYDNNYQYDGGMYPDYSSLKNNEVFTTANVFSVSANSTGELIRAASFQCYKETNVEYTVQIYTGLTPGTTDPRDGVLRTTAVGRTGCAGYYTVPLPESVPVTRGDVFSVVVTLRKVGSQPKIGTENTKESDWYKSTASAKPGQSFYFNNVRWIDSGAANNRNYRIKAFTENATLIAPNSVSIGDNLPERGLTMQVNGVYKPSVTVGPEEAVVKDCIWRCSDPMVASVDPDNGTVTAKAAGIATITATAIIGGASSSYTLTVTGDGPEYRNGHIIAYREGGEKVTDVVRTISKKTYFFDSTGHNPLVKEDYSGLIDEDFIVIDWGCAGEQRKLCLMKCGVTGDTERAEDGLKQLHDSVWYYVRQSDPQDDETKGTVIEGSFFTDEEGNTLYAQKGGVLARDQFITVRERLYYVDKDLHLRKGRLSAFSLIDSDYEGELGIWKGNHAYLIDEKGIITTARVVIVGEKPYYVNSYGQKIGYDGTSSGTYTDPVTGISYAIDEETDCVYVFVKGGRDGVHFGNWPAFYETDAEEPVVRVDFVVVSRLSGVESEVVIYADLDATATGSRSVTYEASVMLGGYYCDEAFENTVGLLTKPDRKTYRLSESGKWLAVGANGEQKEWTVDLGITEDLYYTGKPVTLPNLNVYWDDYLLVQNKDYSLKYDANTNAGTATVTITGKGDFLGTVDRKTFVIRPVDIGSAVFFAENVTIREQDAVKTPILKWNQTKVKDSQFRVIYPKDLAGRTITTGTRNVAPGTYEITISAETDKGKPIGNFRGKRICSLIVAGGSKKTSPIHTLRVRADTNLAVVTPGETGPQFDEKNYLQKVTLTWRKKQFVLGRYAEGGSEFVRAEDFEDGELKEDARTYFTVQVLKNGTQRSYKAGKTRMQITATDNALSDLNLTGTKYTVVNLTGSRLDPKHFSFDALGANRNGRISVPYTGDIYTLESILTAYGRRPDDYGQIVTLYRHNMDYTVSYRNNMKAGTMTVVFTGAGAYTGSVSKSVTIAKVTDYLISVDGTDLRVTGSGFASVSSGDKNPAKVVYHAGALRIENLTVRALDGIGDGVVLREGVDYSLQLKGKNRPGETVKATIAGKGNYGKVSFSYVIVPNEFTRDTVYAGSADQLYQSSKGTVGSYIRTAAKKPVLFDRLTGKTIRAETSSAANDYRFIGYVDKDGTPVSDRTTLGEIQDEKGGYTIYGQFQSAGGYDAVSQATLILPVVHIYTEKMTRRMFTVKDQSYSGRSISLSAEQFTAYPGDSDGKGGLDTGFEILGYSNNVRKGTAMVTVRGIGEYGGIIRVPFRIRAWTRGGL